MKIYERKLKDGRIVKLRFSNEVIRATKVRLWARKNLPKPKVCIFGKKAKPYEVHSISYKFKKDLKDWEWLCESHFIAKIGRCYNWPKNERI